MTPSRRGALDACEACGAPRLDGRSCDDDFHTLLAWEYERPELRQLHHLLVLTYHVQHPHLYSPEGLAYARRMLADFLVGMSSAAARARGQAVLGSDRRGWKLTATPTSRGSHPRRPYYPLTVAAVVDAGIDLAAEQIDRWARTTQAALDRMERGERIEDAR